MHANPPSLLEITLNNLVEKKMPSNGIWASVNNQTKMGVDEALSGIILSLPRNKKGSK